MRKIILNTIWMTLLFAIFSNYAVNAQNLDAQSEFSSFENLIEKARGGKTVSVIVGLNLDTKPEGFLDENGKVEQRRAIKNIQNNLISNTARFKTKVVAKFDYIPFISLEVNEDALKYMKDSPLVLNIAEDKRRELTLAQSIPIIGADDAWNLGYTGQGQVIAVIDTGVDKNHPFLAGKVISEACYSRPSFHDDEFGGTENLCGGEDGPTERTDVDSGLPCGYGACFHGTHVAGIAAGNGVSSGVAKNANIIAIKVVTRFYQILPNGQTTSVISATDTDILKGLERVLLLKNTTISNISSVNLSIGGSYTYSTACGGGSSMEAAILNLKSVSVATVIASGNSSSTTGISYPACIDSAVSVGATGDGSTFNNVTFNTDQVCYFSNSADILDLYAPGGWIYSSIPGGGFRNEAGTSMAAPHVAGAWAILKQRFPNANVDQTLNALKMTGTTITDTRSGANNRQKPRINIDAALAYLQLHLAATKFDFTGDGKTDISVFRPSEGAWYISTNGGYTSAYFGNSTDNLVPADFTGDGKTDIAVWRNSTGEWFILRSEDNTYYSVNWGTTGDIPATGNFDGDNKSENVVYRPSDQTWYILKSTGGFTSTQFGNAEDKPVVGDYDGDGRDDIAVFRPSLFQWWILASGNNTIMSTTFGTTGDKTVQGDYTGDGKTDIAVFRPSTGYWYILRSEDQSFYGIPFGNSTDKPVPGDYDGDGKTDIAVFRPAEGNWYILGSSGTIPVTNFGNQTDIPVPGVYSVP